MPEPTPAPTLTPGPAGQSTFIRLPDGTFQDVSGWPMEKLQAFRDQYLSAGSIQRQAGVTASFRPTPSVAPTPLPARELVQAPGPTERYFQNLWQEINPIQGIKGVGELLTHPRATFRSMADAHAMIDKQAEKDIAEGRLWQGYARKAFNSYIAAGGVFGPGISQSVDLAEKGDVAGALGKLTGMALPFAAGAAVGGAVDLAETGGRRMVASALRSTSPAAVADAEVNAMIENSIGKSAGGAAKAGRILQAKEAQTAAVAAKAPGTVDPFDAITGLDKMRSEAARAGAEARTAAGLATTEDIDAFQQRFLSSLKEAGGWPRDLTAQDVLDQVRLAQTPASFAGPKFGQMQQALAESAVKTAETKIPELATALKDETVYRSLVKDMIDGMNVSKGGAKALGIWRSLARGDVGGVLSHLLQLDRVQARLGVTLARAAGGAPGAYTEALAKIGGLAQGLGDRANEITQSREQAAVPAP